MLAENDVFVIDVAMTSGDGKPRDMGVRHTVYRRNPAVRYELKLKTARQFMGEVLRHAPVMPFSLRCVVGESWVLPGCQQFIMPSQCSWQGVRQRQ